MPKKTLNTDGCEFGRVNRLRLKGLEENQDKIMLGIENIDTKTTNMFNHFTERYEEMFKKAMSKVPQWALAIGAIGSFILGALIVFVITHL